MENYMYIQEWADILFQNTLKPLNGNYIYGK